MISTWNARSKRRGTALKALALVLTTWSYAGLERAYADSISSALARAYAGNQDLNQSRAGTRAADEVVARANAGYRPQITGTASFGYNNTDQVFNTYQTKVNSFPTGAALNISQTVFNGNRTSNGVRQAESLMMQSREVTRNTEQNTLQNAATAYMNMLRDTAIVELYKNNVTVLQEQVRETRGRFVSGDLTKTDLAQAESSLALGQSTYFVSQANLQTSDAYYRQIIGVPPTRLEAARPLDSLLPDRPARAIEIAIAEHPSIQAAFHNVDAARLQVQLNEAQLYPTVAVVANVQNNNQYVGSPSNRLFNASVLGQVNVPLYTGGETYASVRQAKELLAQARLQADLQRNIVRANVVSIWGQYKQAKAVIKSSALAVKASELALNGVREEARVGQRTTLDVLIAQQTLVQSRVNLVTSQRDRVVASYSLMAAIGMLTASRLSLDVVTYDPTVHYDQVKDKWAGLRTPSGE